MFLHQDQQENENHSQNNPKLKCDACKFENFNTEEIKLLKQHVEDLKKYNQKETEIRIENEKQIKLLKEQVEELRKITAPETCAQYVKQGATRGEDIYLDSDGVNHGKKAAVCTITILIALSFFYWIHGVKYLLAYLVIIS